MYVLTVISVIKNAESSLQVTLESMAQEKTSEIEYIVVDGGSTDGSFDMVSRFSWLIDRFIPIVDTGVYDGMNQSIGYASGEFIIFMNAGDKFYDGVISKILPVLRRTSSSVLYGDAITPTGYQDNSNLSSIKLIQKNICHQAILFRRSLFEQIGRFDVQFITKADHDFNLRWFARGGIRKEFIGIPVCVYQGGGLSETVEDKLFYRKKGDLISRYFGFWYGLAYRLKNLFD